MIMENGTHLRKEQTASDAIVSGLFAGLLAGILMGVYLLIWGLIAGSSPSELLLLFAQGQSATPLSGALLHLGVSAVYGSLFGLLCHWLPRRWLSRVPLWALGLLYGLLLFALAELALIPGIGSALEAIPPLQFGLAHVVYGLGLGFLAKIR
jgi:hypothetical protein